MKSTKNHLDYGLISKYRSLLMGLAIILIMFCHLDIAQGHNGADHTFLAGLLQTGTVGVDIFLLLSGVGLYYSYTKNPLPYIAFIRKRVQRILPLYFLIGGSTYLIYDILICHLSVGKFLRDLFFVSWYSEKSTRYWYVLAIIVFYFLFPSLYVLIHGKNCSFFKTMLFCIIWWVGIETLCHSVDSIITFRIALERLPIFILGIYIGKMSYQKQPVKDIHLVLYVLGGLLLLFLLKRVFHDPLKRYLYYPIRGALSVSIISIVIIIMEMLMKIVSQAYDVILHVLVWFGALTYELYLLHQSYMILFDFPYKFLTYFIVAFVLPIITAAGIKLSRNLWRLSI